MALESLQLGQYRLLRLLGSGGMGEVYLAEDARINHTVAIKVSKTGSTAYPHTDTTQDALRLFQREAKAIASLDHPHILSLLSYGEEQVADTTYTYIVMPYRPEGSFASWLQQRGENVQLSIQDVAYFISQAADALYYVHEHGIVHQDIKPSNFLLRANREHPQLPDLLLADFGIARLSLSTISVSHAIRGTPVYMAPEQWTGEPFYATDQYALAILAYELLAGRPPFLGRQEQIMYQHLHVQPQPASMLNRQISEDIDAVLLRALAKRPEDRFPTIAAFAAAFKEAIDGLDAPTMIKSPATLRQRDRYPASAIQGDSFNQTLPVTHSLVDTTLPQTQRGEERSASHSPALAPLTTDHTVQSQSAHRGISTGTAILLVGLAFLLLVGGFGLFYLHSISSPSPTVTTTNRPTNSGAGTPSAQTTTSLPTATAQTTAVNPTATTNSVTVTSTPSSATVPSSSYVQLQPSYSGTASGYTAGAITFTLNSEDQQGNVTMDTTFQQLEGARQTASYTCQGAVTLDRHLNLQCSNVADSTYVLTIQAYIYPDGHMEGTETATNTSDSGYNHVYSWTAY